MIRDFREKLDISKSDLSKEISNQIADIDIKLDINAKKYNLKNMNELIAKQKLLNKLKTKLENNEEVYVKNKSQLQTNNQHGGDFLNLNDATFSGSAINANLIILDLQSVLKYKPNGSSVVEDNALDELQKQYASDDSLLHVICDDNHTYDSVTEKIPKLKNWLNKDNFHKVSGFLHIKDAVKDILKKYTSWINDPTKNNNKIIYISRNWNKDKQVHELNSDNKINLIKDANDENKYKDGNISVEFMDKDKVSAYGNYKDQLYTTRSLRESMQNTKWMNPFIMNKNHFKSLMTRLRVDDNGSLQKY